MHTPEQIDASFEASIAAVSQHRADLLIELERVDIALKTLAEYRDKNRAEMKSSNA